MKSGSFIAGAVVIVVSLAFLLIVPFVDTFKDNNQKVEGIRFISYDNGTVLDSETGLMWAARDNGDAVAWKEAKEYCEDYNAGGYKDWRMPTVEELETLYDEDAPGYRPECAVYDWKVYLTGQIHLSGAAAWASVDNDDEAECFMFDYGSRSLMFKNVNFIMRAMPVRNAR